MGVLPLQFHSQDSVQSLGIRGDEVFSILGLEGALTPGQEVVLSICRCDGSQQEVRLKMRVDTPIEVDYLHHGGILPYVLRGLLQGSANESIPREGL
jgi:aconitate hydratase